MLLQRSPLWGDAMTSGTCSTNPAMLPPRKEFIRESLDWLDKYLAPVKR
jgi:hypothetical protein